jgi:hypothetical protein
MSSSSDYNICKAFAEADNSIFGAGIVEDMEFVAWYSKRGRPRPKEGKFQQLVIQAEIFVSLAKSNADLFGRFHYVAMSYEDMDIILISLPNGRSNNKPRLLGVSVSKPYDVTKVLEKLHIT